MANKSLKKNFVFNLVKTLMTLLFPAVSFPYASRILGVEKIGAVQYSVSIVSYFALFAALGISAYAIREGSKIRKDAKELSKFSTEILILNLLSTVAAYTVLFLFIGLQAFNGYVTLILVCSLVLAFNTLSVEWLYQIMEDYGYISIRSAVIQIVSLVLLFTFVKSKNDYLLYAFITVFASSGYFLWNLLSSRKFIKFFPRVKYDLAKHIRPILTLFGVSIASAIYLNIDVVLIGSFLGDFEVGLFTVAFNINVIVRNLIASVGIVFLPRLTEFLVKGRTKEYNRLLKNGVELNLMLSIPCSAGLFCLSYQALYIVSGIEFVGATHASQILAINLIFSTLESLIYYEILIPNNLEKKAAFGTFMGALINIGLNCVLIPVFSYNGAAVATLIAEITVTLFFLWILRKKINLNLNYSS